MSVILLLIEEQMEKRNRALGAGRLFVAIMVFEGGDFSGHASLLYQ